VKVLIAGPSDNPEAVKLYLSWWAQQPQSDLEMVIGWLSLFSVVASILAAFAMFAYLSLSRIIFAVSIMFLIAGEGLVDYPVLKEPVEQLLDLLIVLLAGSIVSLVYWSPVSDEFKK